jgi:hypothetical protein
VSSLFGIVRLVYIPSTLLVSGNAAATANNIADHELLFRFGIISYLLGSAVWIFVTLALYRLLRGVDEALARLMVIITVVITPIFFVNTANDVAALLFARGADFLSIFDKAQREGLVMLFLNLHHQIDVASELLWILFHVPFGLVVYRSRFLPPVSGVRTEGLDVRPPHVVWRGGDHALAGSDGCKGEALLRNIRVETRSFLICVIA